MRQRLAAMLAASLLGLLVGPGSLVLGQDDAVPTRRHALVGSWIAQGPAPLPAELVTFNDDGTVRSASIDGPSVGSWAPTGRRTANATLVSPFSLPDVGFVGLGTIRGSVEVSRDGQTFSATYTLEFPTAPEGESTDPFPDGQLGPVTVTGQRIAVEPMGEPVGPVPPPEGGIAAASPMPTDASSLATPEASPAP
jgi:hypothetical protein